jgi:hypothetical protein
MCTWMPCIQDMPADEESRVCVAFDLMRVSMQDMLWAPKLMPMLREALKREDVS